MTTPGEEILLSNVENHLGAELGLSDWVELDQMQVNVFGEITRWPTWMHSDQERCRRESPYGDTIVHGFFLVSLITHFAKTAGFNPADGAHHLNYGLDKVRILQPVTIGDGVRIRDRISLLRVVDKGEGRKLCTTAHRIEVDGREQPAAYAEYLGYWIPKTA